MAEKITSKELREVSIDPGTYYLSVEANNPYLEKSDYSNEEIYTRNEILIYELSPNEDYYIVTGYIEGGTTNVSIPSTYDDGVHGKKPVKEIGVSAFAESSIEGVVIPTSVKLIDEFAFYSCKSLKSVGFKNPGKSIAVYFYNKDGWTNVSCSKGGTLIQGSDNILKFMNISGIDRTGTDLYFSGIKNGKSVQTQLIRAWNGSCWQVKGEPDENGNYPVNIYKEYRPPELDDYCTIGHSAFKHASLEGLSLYIYSNTVGVISDYAFESTKINNVYMYPGVREIGDYAFYNCRFLSDFAFPTSLESIGNNALMKAGTGIDPIRYPHLSLYSFPSGYENQLRNIGSNAFRFCETLYLGNYHGSSIASEKMFPNLESLGDNAFYGCYNADQDIPLTQVFTFPSSMKEVGINVFRGCTGLSSVIFEESYGWMFNGISGSTLIDPSTFDDSLLLASLMVIGGSESGSSNPETENIFGYAWYRLSKLPTPEISIIENSIMNIRDPSGLASSFSIYARKEGSETRVYVGSAQVVTEADFE